MGEKVFFNDRAESALSFLEMLLEEIGSTSEDLGGKDETCPLEIESKDERKYDLANISYYLRVKASLPEHDLSHLNEIRNYLCVHGYRFLEDHVPNCRRCMRTLKKRLEEKPKLDKEEIEKLYSVLLLTDVAEKQTKIQGMAEIN